MPGDSDPTLPYQTSWCDPLSYKSEASLPAVSSRPARERPCLGGREMEEREVFSQTDVRLRRKIITRIMEQPVLAVPVLLLLGKQKITGELQAGSLKECCWPLAALYPRGQLRCYIGGLQPKLCS